jgi:anti-sigma factor RsiW
MSENRNAANAGPGAETPRGCERAEEFVTYLYGEATPEESRVFRQHLEACAVCREELAALGGVREAFGVWRAEALGSLPSLDISRALAPAVVNRQTAERKRSASAALREFFSLAPLWLRAGAFAATLALCALSALTLARAEVSWDANGLAFRTGGGAEVTKEQPTAPAQENVYTAQQLDAIVAQRVAEATAQLKEQQRQQPTPEGIVNVSDPDGKSRTQSASPSPQRRKRATRNGSRGDEPLLAEEDNLPRLSDLLNGSY